MMTTGDRRGGEVFRVLDPAYPARDAVAPHRLSFVVLGVGLVLVVLVSCHVASGNDQLAVVLSRSTP